MMYNIRSGALCGKYMTSYLAAIVLFFLSLTIWDIRKINKILKYLTLKIKATVKEEKTEHAQFD